MLGSQGEAPFWIEDTDKLASSVIKMLICKHRQYPRC